MGAYMMRNVEGFCEELSNFLETHHFLPSSVMNFDETRVIVKGGNLVTQRVVAAFKESGIIATTRKNTVSSLITFAVASGAVFLSIYVFKDNFNEDGAADVNFSLLAATRVSRRAWSHYYCWRDTGFLNADLFERVIDLVADEWTTRNPGIPLLLFGDQCSAHMSAKKLERAL
eukprot:TRINITY_DN18172_c0_g1_i1.p2 TRINITY_DN18172_c0_g1~~TRINITY_DN18172_c0_g1_i1.p2  ORF type:complete len:173 (-),score=45.64 TRINITY_DN18172_c0_g1_i1:760-1278(-)